MPWFLLFGFAIYHYDAVTNAKQTGQDIYQKMFFQEMAAMRGYQDVESPESPKAGSESLQTGSNINIEPEISINNYQNNCSVNRHVVFLKTHKTGR